MRTCVAGCVCEYKCERECVGCVCVGMRVSACACARVCVCACALRAYVCVSVGGVCVVHRVRVC